MIFSEQSFYDEICRVRGLLANARADVANHLPKRAERYIGHALTKLDALSGLLNEAKERHANNMLDI